MKELPTIASFAQKSDLILTPAPNGGWIVNESEGEPGLRPRLIGAYSSAEDMLGALSQALVEAKP